MSVNIESIYKEMRNYNVQVQKTQSLIKKITPENVNHVKKQIATMNSKKDELNNEICTQMCKIFQTSEKILQLMSEIKELRENNRKIEEEVNMNKSEMTSVKYHFFESIKEKDERKIENIRNEIINSFLEHIKWDEDKIKYNEEKITEKEEEIKVEKMNIKINAKEIKDLRNRLKKYEKGVKDYCEKVDEFERKIGNFDGNLVNLERAFHQQKIHSFSLQMQSH